MQILCHKSKYFSLSVSSFCLTKYAFCTGASSSSSKPKGISLNRIIHCFTSGTFSGLQVEKQDGEEDPIVLILVFMNLKLRYFCSEAMKNTHLLLVFSRKYIIYNKPLTPHEANPADMATI